MSDKPARYQRSLELGGSHTLPEIRTVFKENAELRSEVFELREDLRTSNNKISDLESSNNALRMRIAQLERHLA